MHQGHRTSPRRMHKTTVIWTKFSAANTRYTLVLWQHNSKIHVTTEATVTRNSSFQNTRNTTTIISTSSLHTATGLARELLPLDQFTHLSDKYMEALASFEFCYLFYLTCRIHIMYGTILNALDRVSIFSPLFPQSQSNSTKALVSLICSATINPLWEKHPFCCCKIWKYLVASTSP